MSASKMVAYAGSCHCGDIRFTFTGPGIRKALGCNCSICKRKGVCWTSFTVKPDQVRIDSGRNSITSYRFGTMTANHYFCSSCGIFTFVQTRLNPGEYRFNLGCIDGVDPFALAVDIYDGESL